MSIEDDQKRYHGAAHAMQSGVAAEMTKDNGPTTPKHLRVGVNSALVNQEGLAQLLIDKGLITEEEYTKAIADAMEREVGRYEERLAEMFGKGIHLA